MKHEESIGELMHSAGGQMQTDIYCGLLTGWDPVPSIIRYTGDDFDHVNVVVNNKNGKLAGMRCRPSVTEVSRLADHGDVACQPLPSVAVVRETKTDCPCSEVTQLGKCIT
ncbi:hypothetical protein LSAT2_029512 [Lamellibrachia satsuma]|nr:hypothetical protein LSAT2_029512 [Lamellibrachia satsuma]